MAAKGARPTTLLLLLLAACLAPASGRKWSALNDLFRKNHVDVPKTEAIDNNAYCNMMMGKRWIYKKLTNTFIHGIVPGLSTRNSLFAASDVLPDIPDAARAAPSITTTPAPLTLPAPLTTTPAPLTLPAPLTTTPAPLTTTTPQADTEQDINKVCTTGGLAAGPFKRVSKAEFSITTCTFIPWSLSYIGVSSKAKIVITCWKGLPAVFVKSIQASA